ncbi:yqkD, partial [Symbiodinium sp. CCMP2456]
RGLTLVCTIFEPENPAHTAKTDEKAVVVCCHGNACSRLDAFLQVYCFLPLNIAVCCFDFSGSGMSGGEYVSLGYFERDDLAAVIQNLREKRGYTR